MADIKQEYIFNPLADYGIEPASTPLSEEQQKLVAVMMGISAAFAQLVGERVASAADQVHFMLHLSDFIGRLAKGEAFKLPGAPQTFAVNSKAGNLFLIAAEEMLQNGHEDFERIMKQLKKASAEIGSGGEAETEAKPKYLH